MTVEIDNSILLKLLPREEDSHKGTFGTLAMLCGSERMPGAAYLAAMGALRSGLGLLQIAAEGELLSVLQSRLAEPVWLKMSSLPSTAATAFLCGCGLGRSQDTLLTDLLPKITVPAVYDADCINFFSLHKDVLNKLSSPFILTPHPAEFSRLTGLSVEEIQKNRIETAKNFAVEYKCVLVLKGKGTVVASPEGNIWVNTSGCNALSKGGSGDVLAGVIASLLAQGHSCTDAACIGVYAHGAAGENLAVRYGARCVLPSDLPMEIGKIL